jgi:hypothetical protein
MTLPPQDYKPYSNDHEKPSKAKGFTQGYKILFE